MSDLLKKLALVGLAYGGLEYVKYRFEGGKPLLERVRETVNTLKDFCGEEDPQEPIVLEAGDYKVV